MGGRHTLLCDLRVRIGAQFLEYKHLATSENGAYFLPPAATPHPLLPGQVVRADLRLPHRSEILKNLTCRVIRELTLKEEHLGICFDWSAPGQAEAGAQLKNWIETLGKPVALDRRKHARLGRHVHPAFPKLAIANLASESIFAGTGPEYEPWGSTVDNLSQAGILISTTSPLALNIRPGDGIMLRLDPSLALGATSDTSQSIHTLGHVRRIVESSKSNDRGQNEALRSFGLRFEWHDSDQHERYTKLIKSGSRD